MIVRKGRGLSRLNDWIHHQREHIISEDQVMTLRSCRISGISVVIFGFVYAEMKLFGL